MSYSNNNPFVRGYDGLSVERLLAISYDDDCPLTYLRCILAVESAGQPDRTANLHLL